MPILWHLAGQGVGSTYRYVRISGTPGSPSVEKDIEVSSLATSAPMSIFSVDGGTTLWMGGGWSSFNLYKMWFSADGGDTWQDGASKIPYGGQTTIHSLWGLDGGILLLCTDRNNLGVNGGYIAKWNPSTEVFDLKQDLLQNQGGWSIHGTSTALYCCAGFAGSDGVWRSLDQGETWVKETTLPSNPYHVAESSSGLIIAAGQTWIRSGTWDSWANEDIASTQMAANSSGRGLGVDETGAFWALCYDTGAARHCVYRRDPGTSIWSKEFQFTNSAPEYGGIWVVDSNNIIATHTGELVWWDGNSWTVLTYASLGLGGSLYRGIWGALGDEVPPAITIVSPLDGDTGVGRSDPICFRLSDEDTGVDLDQLVVRVRGRVVVSGGALVDGGWSYAVRALPLGYVVALTPRDRLDYHVREGNEVAVYVQDGGGNPASRVWIFYAGRILDRIFPMLIDSIERDT